MSEKMHDDPETLAIRALGWLASQPEQIRAFMDETGATADTMRSGAGDPGLLGAVLDFILRDDARVTQFCAAAGYRPDQPPDARARLPGGAEWHWT